MRANAEVTPRFILIYVCSERLLCVVGLQENR